MTAVPTDTNIGWVWRMLSINHPASTLPTRRGNASNVRLLLSRPDLDLSMATGDGNHALHLCAFAADAAGAVDAARALVEHARDRGGMDGDHFRE